MEEEKSLDDLVIDTIIEQNKQIIQEIDLKIKEYEEKINELITFKKQIEQDSINQIDILEKKKVHGLTKKVGDNIQFLLDEF